MLIWSPATLITPVVEAAEPPVAETEPYAYHDWREAPGGADETRQDEPS